LFEKKSFFFNLETLSGACVFSIGVCFDEDLIVKRSDFFNHDSKNNGEPIEERTFARNPFVFEKNKPFELVITIEEQFYEVNTLSHRINI